MNYIEKYRKFVFEETNFAIAYLNVFFMCYIMFGILSLMTLNAEVLFEKEHFVFLKDGILMVTFMALWGTAALRLSYKNLRDQELELEERRTTILADKKLKEAKIDMSNKSIIDSIWEHDKDYEEIRSGVVLKKDIIKAMNMARRDKI